MAKKKTEAEVVPAEAKPINELSLYECAELEKKLNALAEANDGEITEEQMEQLIGVQMRSIEKIESLCKWIRKGEGFIDVCKGEIDRIGKMIKSAQSRIECAKHYMTGYVAEKGKIQAGTFELSVRKSEAVLVPDGFDDPFFCKTKTVVTPDKTLIKKALQDGNEVPGCEIETRMNLQIK